MDTGKRRIAKEKGALMSARQFTSPQYPPSKCFGEIWFGGSLSMPLDLKVGWYGIRREWMMKMRGPRDLADDIPYISRQKRKVRRVWERLHAPFIGENKASRT